MRQIVVQVPQGQGDQVLEIAAALHGANLACLSARNQQRPLDLVYINISNRKWQTSCRW